MRGEVVHRVGHFRMVQRALCQAELPYRPTDLACTVVEHADGPIDFNYVDSPVDCMACLVREARW